MRGKTVCGRASQFLRRENVNSVNQKIVRPPLLSDVENKPVCPGREGKRNLASGNEKIPPDFRVVHLNMRRAIELNGTIACHAGRVADAGAIRFPIGTRRAEPEEMSRFTEATDAYFGSDPLILSFPEQAPQLVLAGKLSGKMEEFRAFLRSRQIDGCAIGYSDAQQSPDICAEGIAKAKQALKIACLNPGRQFLSL